MFSRISSQVTNIGWVKAKKFLQGTALKSLKNTNIWE